MLGIKTVLCPVDLRFVPKTAVDFAMRLAESFEARLVLHHDLPPGPPAFLGAGWMHDEVHSKDDGAEELDAETKLRGLLARAPKGVRAEAVLTRGERLGSIRRLVQELPAQLVVMATHRESPESLTESVLREVGCPVVAFHADDALPKLSDEGAVAGRAVAIVSVDFTKAAERALEYAIAVTEALGIKLHVVHVEPSGARKGDVEAAERHLRELIPSQELPDVTLETRTGRPVESVLLDAREHDAGMIFVSVPGSRLFASRHQAGLWTLHGSHCPVWFVPEGVRMEAATV